MCSLVEFGTLKMTADKGWSSSLAIERGAIYQLLVVASYEILHGASEFSGSFEHGKILGM
jgi:hypothetical protein